MGEIARSGANDCNLSAVMPGLAPGIHEMAAAHDGVDGRDKPGHDDAMAAPS
ncbi:hypothetical protein V3H18_10965 [Methylocystis sp. 9N]|uniref:Uncharacterized protein n=1 Tax=Methylocystis borbori TaxID=3118750 RepID=A0ABU7XI52_9HYPH